MSAALNRQLAAFPHVAVHELCWLFGPHRYLRIAAIAAAEISAGELKPGQRLVARQVMARSGWRRRRPRQAAGTLLDGGWLIDCGAHVRVAGLAAGRQ